ncbi:MAG: GGDEF domain-containing protein [Nitrospirae bacterium]|nr:GGDEF domain-containing protein [Nitrospirota bacterium]
MPDIAYITNAKGRDNLYAILDSLSPGRVTKVSPSSLISKRIEPGLLVVKRDILNYQLFRKIKKRFDQYPLLVVYTKAESKEPLYLKDEMIETVDSNPEEIKNAVLRLLKQQETLQEIQRLKEEIRELNSLLEIQKNITSIMRQSHDIYNLFVEMMKTLKGVFDVRNWVVFVKDFETDELVLTLASLKRKELQDVRLQIGEGIAGWVAEKARPLIIEDVRDDIRSKAEERIHRIMKSESVLVFPLSGTNSVIAVVELINKRKGEFSKKDLLMLTRIQDQLSVAVEKVMLQLKLEELVITDDLTKLFNSRYLNRTLDIEVERSNRYNTSVSLIFMDIDHFKDVNDRYGHLVGSKLLTELAQLLLSRLRSVDIVARYGGDEFVIVLPQTSSKYAAMIAERLRKTVAEATFLKSEGLNIRITASFGVACYPETARSKEELLRLADEAMYKVKYKNRNGVYVII